MSAYRKYWDEEIETLSREKLKTFQYKLLKDMLSIFPLAGSLSLHPNTCDMRSWPPSLR